MELQEIEKMAYSTFAKLHPAEAFEHNNTEFMKFMKEQGYNLTIKEVEKIIKEIE